MSPPEPQVPGWWGRRWSTALADAGLYPEALRVHPAAERADIVRRAELAVLAGNHKLALHLLSELKTRRTARVAVAARSDAPGPAETHWLELLTRYAQLLRGDGGRFDDVLGPAEPVRLPAQGAWVLALAGAAVGDLEPAAAAAASARAGGCRDLRIPAILAADRAAEGDDLTALDLLTGAVRRAVAGPDPVGFTLDLLDRAGLRADAQRLALLGAGDRSAPRPARTAWKSGARRVGTTRPRLLRSSLAAAVDPGEWPWRWPGRRLRDGARPDLTCRCYGSAGWIGAERMDYVSGHLSELPAPVVTGLRARLLGCRATNLTFLDLAEHRLTLPVGTRPG